MISNASLRISLRYTPTSRSPYLMSSYTTTSSRRTSAGRASSSSPSSYSPPPPSVSPLCAPPSHLLLSNRRLTHGGSTRAHALVRGVHRALRPALRRAAPHALASHRVLRGNRIFRRGGDGEDARRARVRRTRQARGHGPRQALVARVRRGGHHQVALGQLWRECSHRRTCECA